MSIRTLFEDMLRIRIKGKPNNNGIPVELDDNKSVGEFIKDLENSNIVDMSQLNQFRTLSTNRETQCKYYDQMSEDSVIAGALEMYADDATQYNDRGKVIWAEPVGDDSKDAVEFANKLIDDLNLDKNSWSYIYNLCKYGDIYLETYRDNEIDNDEIVDKVVQTNTPYANIQVTGKALGSVLERYIEMYPNPAEIFDLTRRGKTVGFVQSKVIEDTSDPFTMNYTYIREGDEVEILPSDKFIHISLGNETSRYPEKLKLKYSDDENNIRLKEYRVLRGKSVLHDIYKTYREVSLMEDSLLLNRVTRSSIIRLLQVEIGDMPKTQARELLKRIKNMVEQKNVMDKDEGTFSSTASPGPIDNIIYIPTRNGKGNVSASNLGGDVDVKSIADIDYYKNKMYAGLKTPKQYLGEDVDGGLGGGTSLTKISSRYARSVKRAQTSYTEGITTLINIFAINCGLPDHVNKFVIKMVSPSTTEDQERDESLDSRVNIISNLMNLISDSVSPEASKKILMYFMSNYFNEPDITNIMEEDNKEDKKDEDEDDEDGFGEFEGSGSPSMRMSPPSSDDLDDVSNEPEERELLDLDIDNNEELGNDTFSDEDQIDIVDDNGFGDFRDEF